MGTQREGGMRSQKTSKNRPQKGQMEYEITKEILNEAIEEQISQHELMKQMNAQVFNNPQGYLQDETQRTPGQNFGGQFSEY